MTCEEYPARLFEQACDHAVHHHIHRYKQVRAIVERLFEQVLDRLDRAPKLTLSLTQDHAPIRPVAEYGELFSLGAQNRASNESRPINNGEDQPAPKPRSRRLRNPGQLLRRKRFHPTLIADQLSLLNFTGDHSE